MALASNSPYLGCCVTLTGRALAEAALGGVPIVAYDIDWHSEAVETGVTGELVPTQIIPFWLMQSSKS